MEHTLPIAMTQLKILVEAALFSAAEPVPVEKLLAWLDSESPCTLDQLQSVLQALTEDYQDRGIELKQVASGYRFQVQTRVAPWLLKWQEEKPSRYSRALLETLALIAYRQPITRAEIEEVRGVSVSSHIVRTLLERDWIKVVGHKELPGRPALYSTTKAFLDYFNLKSLAELPALAEFVQEDCLV